MAKSKSSFTTAEVIIAIGIFALIGIVIFGWQKDLFYLNNLFSKRLATQENIRKTIKNFIAELRTAQPSDNGGYPLEQVNKDSFIFYSDLDNDGKRERIRYFLDSNKKLKKGVTKSSGQPPVYNPDDEVITVLVQNIINPNDEIFYYYDQDYDGDDPPLPQPVNISVVRLVQITIKVDEDISRPPEPIIETSQVSIRNLKDNL